MHAPTSVLAHVEHALALSRPFGDPEYFWPRAVERYAHRVATLAHHLPQAAAARDALAASDANTRARVLSDPLIRGTINRALAHVRLHQESAPLAELQELLEFMTASLRDPHPTPPLHRTAPKDRRLGAAEHHGWIWMDSDRPDDLPTRGFRTLFDQHLHAAGLRLSTPEPGVLASLTAGAALLDTVLPALSRSALGHAKLIGIVDHPRGFQSVTNPFIPGAIFLSRTVVATPWSAAEFLLHEALHQEYVDLEHVLAFHQHTPGVEPHLIRPPWRRGKSSAPNAWTVKHSLTVLHVYTALALFFQTLIVRREELVSRFGPPDGLNLALATRRALDRASYLAREIAGDSAELGSAGRLFVDWLRELLDTLSVGHGELGTSATLALDLYDRETEQIGTLVARVAQHANGLQPVLRQQLDGLLTRDLDAVSELSRALGLPVSWMVAFTNGHAGRRDDQSWDAYTQRWWGLRTLVGRTLRAWPASEMVGLNGRTATLDEHIEAMVRDIAPAIEDVIATCDAARA